MLAEKHDLIFILIVSWTHYLIISNFIGNGYRLISFKLPIILHLNEVLSSPKYQHLVSAAHRKHFSQLSSYWKLLSWQDIPLHASCSPGVQHLNLFHNSVSPPPSHQEHHSIMPARCALKLWNLNIT